MSAKKRPEKCFWIKGIWSTNFGRDGTTVNFILAGTMKGWRSLGTVSEGAVQGGWFELSYDELTGYVEVVGG